MVRFFTFEQFHNKQSIGSTNLRVHQLIKYWDEAEIYKYGENPDVLVFQKVYCSPDYKFPAHFENTKILDICDPDWLNGVTCIKETVDAVDAVTCSSKELQRFMSQLTDKPVHHIPDRFDLELVPKPKKHTKQAKTVVWFGYRHNAETLKPALPLLEELNLNLVIISEDDPLLYRNSMRDHKQWYKFVKYDEDTIYQELQKADFALLPKGLRPVDRFKSNNKTIKSNLAGLSVATDSDEVRKYLNPKARQDFIDKQYDIIKEEYDVRKSVEQMKEIIEKIRER